MRQLRVMHGSILIPISANPATIFSIFPVRDSSGSALSVHQVDNVSQLFPLDRPCDASTPLPAPLATIAPRDSAIQTVVAGLSLSILLRYPRPLLLAWFPHSRCYPGNSIRIPTDVWLDGRSFCYIILKQAIHRI